MTVINESFEDLEEWPWPRACAETWAKVRADPAVDALCRKLEAGAPDTSAPPIWMGLDMASGPDMSATIIYDSGPIECEYTHDHTGRLTIQTPGGVTHPDFEGQATPTKGRTAGGGHWRDGKYHDGHDPRQSFGPGMTPPGMRAPEALGWGPRLAKDSLRYGVEWTPKTAWDAGYRTGLMHGVIWCVVALTIALATLHTVAS